MKLIKPQAMCAEMSDNAADRLAFVRDALQDLQGNVAWIQDEAQSGLASLALRGLVMEFQDLIGQIEKLQAVIN